LFTCGRSQVDAPHVWFCVLYNAGLTIKYKLCASSIRITHKTDAFSNSRTVLLSHFIYFSPISSLFI
jgi:hypothetical protein